MTVFHGARDHDMPSRPGWLSLYGPLLLIALAAGMLAGVALIVMGVRL